MSLAQPAVLLRTVRDSRPPAHCWTDPSALRAVIESAGLTSIRAEAREAASQVTSLPGAVGPDPALPEVREWATWLAVGVVQVLGGRRSVSQLERWLRAAALSSLTAAAALRRRARAHERGGSAGVPRVRSVHVQCLTPRVAEVAVHVRTGEDSTAVALRLEGAGERWVCTALALDAFALAGRSR